MTDALEIAKGVVGEPTWRKSWVHKLATAYIEKDAALIEAIKERDEARRQARASDADFMREVRPTQQALAQARSRVEEQSRHIRGIEETLSVRDAEIERLREALGVIANPLNPYGDDARRVARQALSPQPSQESER